VCSAELADGFSRIGACQWLGMKALELVQEIANGAVGVSLDLSPDWHVFVWTATLSLVTGIAVGILPALRESRGGIGSTLKQGTSGGFGSVGIRRNRNLLQEAQVASCLILLAAAGLLFRGASRAAHVSPGFNLKQLAIVGMDTRAIALGAARWDILTLVGSQTLRPVAWGAAAGLLGAFGVSGLLRASIVIPAAPDLTYGAGAFDPITFLSALSAGGRGCGCGARA
jgi:hypothetical protein